MHERGIPLRIRRPDKKSLLIFLAVLGPGIITASVDNDAGGIATYSIAGAHFGYSLLWTLLPITVALIVVQEMVARMGVVTGKTLATSSGSSASGRRFSY
jgi:Mn2+/Fe2+ NRAMP family transporter